MKRVHFPIFPAQGDFIEATNRFVAYIGGLGAGKTFAGAVKAITLAQINQGFQGMILSPNYSMLEKNVMPPLEEVLKKMGLHYTRRKSAPPFINIAGSKVWLATADRPENLPGTTVAWLWIDEFAFISEEAWQKVSPRVRAPKAPQRQTIFTGTFECVHKWVDKYFLDFDPAKRDLKIINAPSSENLALEKSYVKELRDTLSDDEYETHIEGKMLRRSLKGRVYTKFDDLSVDDCIPDNGFWFLSCDFNVNPCCWIIGKVVDRVIYAVDEIIQKDTDTYAMCKTAVKLLKAYGTLPEKTVIYGDASGFSRRTSGKTDYLIMKEHDFKHLDIPRANPPVKDRVNAVNRSFYHGKFIVNSRCPNLIKDFERVQWLKDSPGVIDKKTNRDLTHASDAVGYGIYRNFDRRIKRIRHSSLKGYL